MQRFTAVTQKFWTDKAFAGKTEIEIGKMLSNGGIMDFNQTHAMNRLEFAAMVAYPANDQPSLCEFPGAQGLFQPEIKKVDDLWFASTGSGQSITDPFLALLRKVYWRDEARPARRNPYQSTNAAIIITQSWATDQARLC
jgi:hypothetical protein